MTTDQLVHELLAFTSQHYAAIVAALLVIYVCTPSAQERSIAHLPKPASTLPILGNTLDFLVTHRKKLHTWLTNECARRQGKPWVARMLGCAPIIVVSSEQSFRDVLTQLEIFGKGKQSVEALSDVFGDSVIMAHGAKWHHERKVASNLFTMNMMRTLMSDVIVQTGTTVCEILGRAADMGESVEVKHLMELFTNDAFAKIGFGVDLDYLKHDNHEFFARVNRLGHVHLQRMLGVGGIGGLWKLFRWLNIGLEKQHKDDMRWIDAFIYDVINQSIAQKQSSEEARRDLVTLFMEHNPPEAFESPEAQMRGMRDMAITFLFAGRSTTANSLNWLVVMLAQNPHVQDKIRAELREKLPDLVDGNMQVPTKDQIGVLTYLEAVIRENLRLNPTIPVISRIADQDTTLSDGTFVKQGTIVMLPLYAMGRMEHLWGPDALEFKPERWIDSKTGTLATMSPFKYVPFGAGPRVCLGKSFSIMESKMIVSALLSKFEFKTAKDPHAYAYLALITLGVDGPLEICPKRLVPKAF
ncbi:Cytochrome p450 [Globisporangium polare]